MRWEKEKKSFGVGWVTLFFSEVILIDVFVGILIQFVLTKNVESKMNVIHNGESNIVYSFIEYSLLVDLPLVGIYFTWLCGDGLPMTLIERFLISK